MSKKQNPSGAAPELARFAHIAEPLRHLAVPIESLALDPANARRHDQKNIDAIKGSLARWGQRFPLVVQKQGMVVRAGNGRMVAARALGWTHIAVLVVDESAVEATAFAVADNRSSELGSWDDEALAQILESLPEDIVPVTGFDDADIRELMGELPPAVDEDVVPEPRPQAVSRRGDLWLLGDQRLLNGDSTSAEDVKRLMNGQRAVLFSTDPPYLVDYDGTNHPNSGKNWHPKRNKDWSETYGTTWDDADQNSELYDKFISTAIAEAITQNAAWYCWHASRRQAMLEAVWVKHGAFVHQQIIWTKNRPVLTRSWYMWKHEPCLMGWIKGKKPARQTKEFMPSVWELATVSSATDGGHPTSKPVRLFAIPMQQHTVEGDVCFEPFSGSGSQMIAAIQLKRRCYGLELEPVYVDVCIRRAQIASGLEATLDGDGRTFNQIEKERLGANSVTGETPQQGAGAKKQEAA